MIERSKWESLNFSQSTVSWIRKNERTLLQQHNSIRKYASEFDPHLRAHYKKPTVLQPIKHQANIMKSPKSTNEKEGKCFTDFIIKDRVTLKLPSFKTSITIQFGNKRLNSDQSVFGSSVNHSVTSKGE